MNGFFEDRMQVFLNELDVRTVTAKAQRRVDALVKATGSEGPRALLAYQMAILHTVERFGSAAFAPVVIDSPNQQDQDASHQERILKFIAERRPHGRQLILGTVETGPVAFQGAEIRLDRRYGVLEEEDYAAAAAELQSYVDAADVPPVLSSVLV